MSNVTHTDTRSDTLTKPSRQRKHAYTREQWDQASHALDHLLEQPAPINRSPLATEIVTLLPKIRALRAKGRSFGEIVKVLGVCGISVSEATLRRIEQQHAKRKDSRTAPHTLARSNSPRC
ncbi:hypothetical protein G3N58_18110 [Paraburkholderia sp. Ac-20342]|uniref:hypothetical protein n=1 Tax=Paraburkholderia sp. Ac-20342 TaxID=2703889 RepID=UPI0019801F69|nr:hypothetical protein [Paraburkholderia sp. Ac-20342]MBN3848725.1 hypothetical protein [Paraburkholderia sp. Ac-20342]